MEEIDNSIAMSIAKFCIFLIIGIVILSSIVSSNHIPDLNRASLTFSGQPLDGDTLTLDNHIFEFDNNNNVANGNIKVTIGSNVDETETNLRAAIQINANYVVS